MMKKILNTLITVFVWFLAVLLTPAQAMPVVSLQVHNPTGGSPDSVEPTDVKSQFVMRNDSTAGINIDSILWQFQNPIFIDSASGGSGFGGFRDYSVSPAQTYGGVGVGEFQITVSANSDTLTGYTGPTALTDGATSLLLTFNSFNAGEAFGFWTDLDSTNDTTGHIGNSDFNGSKTKIIFSDGSVEEYTWALPNNSGRSFYAQGLTGTHSAPEPATMILLGSGLLGALARRKISS